MKYGNRTCKSCFRMQAQYIHTFFSCHTQIKPLKNTFVFYKDIHMLTMKSVGNVMKHFVIFQQQSYSYLINVFFRNCRTMNKQIINKNIPARLAFSPHVHVNFTSISRIFASISLVFGDGPPKKAFAAFASQRVVVVTRGPVATDQTKVFLRSHRPRRLLLLLLGLTLLTWLPANLLTDLPLTSHGICKLR